MKWDFAIGNPPYQGDNHMQLYPDFYIAAQGLADCVEMIFPTGWQEPKNGNNLAKMNKPSVKQDEQIVFIDNRHNVFPDVPGAEWTNIVLWEKGYRNGFNGGQKVLTEGANPVIKKLASHKSELGIPSEIENALIRITGDSNFESFSKIVITSYAYHFSPLLYEVLPDAIGKQSLGHEYDLKSNVFERMPQPFSDVPPQDGHEYLKILGRENNTRVYKYIRRDFINTTKNTDFYKVIVPAAWDVAMLPTIEGPRTGTTETFLTIGTFNTLEEAENCLKYIKTRFARCFLKLNKNTHHVTPETWKYVPLQNFLDNTDIEWSKPVANIETQLFRKYRLSSSEINFVKASVKEMA